MKTDQMGLNFVVNLYWFSMFFCNYFFCFLIQFLSVGRFCRKRVQAVKYFLNLVLTLFNNINEKKVIRITIHRRNISWPFSISLCCNIVIPPPSGEYVRHINENFDVVWLMAISLLMLIFTQTFNNHFLSIFSDKIYKVCWVKWKSVFIMKKYPWSLVLGSIKRIFDKIGFFSTLSV